MNSPKPGPRPPRGVQDEIRQSRPFRSTAQEATIALLRTAAVVERSIAKAIEREGISHAQYNVLRILRGAGRDGLPTLEIRDRMIDASPSITRLLDKLERAGYVRRRRPAGNRRQVLCYLTEQGSAVLQRLDAPVDAADEAAVAALDPDDLHTLIRILGTIRESIRAHEDAEASTPS